MADLLRSRTWPWKTVALCAALGGIVLGGVLLNRALAVHTGTFELDGNVADASGDALIDWQTVFDLGAVVPPATGTPIPGAAETFIHDVPTGSPAKELQYDLGKDSQDTTQWTRKSVTKVVPDKDNILDAFAKQIEVNGHKVIYFGADRFANNGDATMSFWFFQQALQFTGSNGFSPPHTARNDNTGQRGDILVQVDFLNGGTRSQLRIFEWVGSGGSDGALNLLRDPAAVDGATVCDSDDTACATTNNAGGVNTYWPYTPKAGPINKFPAESFFEGGIDITALAGDLCFNTFLASTRSSQQTTSDLKDFAVGDFNTCGSIDLVDKVCNMPPDTVRPSYDPNTEKYTTFHDITIRNDGGGSAIFDVAVRDDSVGGTAGTTCTIIGITGAGVHDPASVPVAFPDKDTFVPVAGSLDAGIANQMTVRIQCASKDNPLHNAASVIAAQTDNGTQSLHDEFGPEPDNTMPANCVFDAAPALELTKACTGPVDKLVKEGGVWKAHVCADITLMNSSDPAQYVDVEAWADAHNDGSATDLISNIPLDNQGRRALAPGDTVSVQDCYNATIFDQDGDNEVAPSQITYGDTVAASGVGRASGTAQAEEKSDVCPLCPPTN
jgi:hypothetical protein